MHLIFFQWKIWGNFDRIPNLQKSCKNVSTMKSHIPFAHIHGLHFAFINQKQEFWILYLGMKITTRTIKFGWYKL